MAELKPISELNTLATVDGAADLLAIVDSDASETKKITIDSLLSQEVWAGGTFTGDVGFDGAINSDGRYLNVRHEGSGRVDVVFGGDDTSTVTFQMESEAAGDAIRHNRTVEVAAFTGIDETITLDETVGPQWTHRFVLRDAAEEVMSIRFNGDTRRYTIFDRAAQDASAVPILDINPDAVSVGLAGAAAPASGVLIDKMLDVDGPSDAFAVIGDRGLEIGQSVNVNANNTCMVVGRNFTNVEEYPTALVAVANAPTEVKNLSGISSSVTIEAGATATGEAVGITAGVINRGTINDVAHGVRSTPINVGTMSTFSAFVAADVVDTSGTVVVTALEVKAGYDYLLESDDLDISGGGIVNFKGTMGNSAKDPTTDAPADWVEIEINGTTRYIPAYAA